LPTVGFLHCSLSIRHSVSPFPVIFRSSDCGCPEAACSLASPRTGHGIGYPDLLRQVFVNLLSNAFKFTRGKATAAVEVACRNEAGDLVYSVRDNGVGLDPKHVGQLFGVFQRLHRADELGTGIGLSVVHRMIQHHGGRIWAEAEVSQVAVFYFTLSKTNFQE
jgi:signal transduction histidine kinase